MTPSHPHLLKGLWSTSTRTLIIFSRACFSTLISFKAHVEAMFKPGGYEFN